MSVIRLIYVKVNSADIKRAEEIWKKECAPLMIQQMGCLSEKLLKCKDEPGEFISYSEWESEQAIEAYRKTPAHTEIVQHARGLQGAKAVVKLYELE